MADEPDLKLEELPRGLFARVSSVLGVALALVLLMVFLLSGGGAELFHYKVPLRTYLGDAGGLERGADVTLNGVRVGKVKHVVLAETRDPNRAVRVDFEVQDRYLANIPVDSIAALTSDSLVGDEFLNIAAGKGLQHVQAGQEIASLIQNGTFNPADLAASLQATLARVDSILTEIQTGNSALAQFVRGTDLYDQILGKVASAQKTIQFYANRNTKVGQLFFTTDMYDQIRQPILNIDHILEELQRGETPAGHFLNSPADYDNAVVQLRDLHKSIVNAQAAPLLKSDEQYRELQASIRSIDQSVDNLTRGEGQFAQLLASSQLYDSLAGQAGQAREFLKEFREDPRKFLRIKLF